MLEGLGITNIKLSVAIANKDFRTDGDFWVKEPKLNPNLKYDKIGNCLVDAQYGISIEMNEDGNGHPVYRMNEIHDMLCDFEVGKSAELSKNELDIFKLNDGDVLFNRTNSFEWVGRTGLFKKVMERDFVFASYLVRFIPNKEIILPEYLTAFLNSKQGVWDVKRRARQSINQTNVNPEEVKQIDIPILDTKIQVLIKECFDKAVANKQASGKLYAEAENLLLQELGLANWLPSIKNNNIKTLKESFIESGRFDAEYYQPKYDEIEEKINKYKGGKKRLEDCLVEISTGEFSAEYKAKQDGLRFYIRNTNIFEGQIIEDQNYFVEPGIFSKFVEEGDILTARVGAIGSFGVISKEFAGSVYSDNVLCLKLKKEFLSDVYTCYFNTILNLELMEKIAGGSVQPLITQTSIKGLLIPKFPQELQQITSSKIKRSFQLKKQSKALLEAAKTAVEIAIEQDEQTALKYLQNFKDA